MLFLLFLLVSRCISSYVKAFFPTYFYCYVLSHYNHFNQMLVLFIGTYNLQAELFNRFLTFHSVYLLFITINFDVFSKNSLYNVTLLVYFILCSNFVNYVNSFFVKCETNKLDLRLNHLTTTYLRMGEMSSTWTYELS